MGLDVEFNLIALVIVVAVVYLGYRLIKSDSDD